MSTITRSYKDKPANKSLIIPAVTPITESAVTGETPAMPEPEVVIPPATTGTEQLKSVVVEPTETTTGQYFLPSGWLITIDSAGLNVAPTNNKPTDAKNVKSGTSAVLTGPKGHKLMVSVLDLTPEVEAAETTPSASETAAVASAIEEVTNAEKDAES